LVAAAMRWAIAAMLLGGLTWLILGVRRRRHTESTNPPRP
jgi:hypothetical protein